MQGGCVLLALANSSNNILMKLAVSRSWPTGLPHGMAQQAVDATIASPVTRAGESPPGADVQPGRALDVAARRKRRQRPRARLAF